MIGRAVLGARQTHLCRQMGFWTGVPQGARDAILGLNEAFAADSDPRKVNLGVGAYRDDAGKPVVLESVRAAEGRVVARNMGHEYAGIAGVPAFVDAAASLAYGTSVDAGRIAAAQSLSGTGALRLGGALLRRFMPGAAIYLPTPTWGNHAAVFGDAGLDVRHYRYYDGARNCVDADGMAADIEAAPQGSAILLHACAHNPTGADPSRDQWRRVADALLARGHTAFFDMAYQGFASGDPDADAWALRHVVSRGARVMLAQSFAKNMGLYGERAGLFSAVCADGGERERVLSQVKILARAMYSNPPVHGARIAAEVLGDAALRATWLGEVRAMAGRMREMRAALRAALEKHAPGRDWTHVTAQIGMFCYTGLGPAQADALTAAHRVYLTRDGRVSVCGLTTANVAYVAQAIADAIRSA